MIPDKVKLVKLGWQAVVIFFFLNAEAPFFPKRCLFVRTDVSNMQVPSLFVPIGRKASGEVQPDHLSLKYYGPFIKLVSITSTPTSEQSTGYRRIRRIPIVLNLRGTMHKIRNPVHIGEQVEMLAALKGRTVPETICVETGAKYHRNEMLQKIEIWVAGVKV